jgi:hypothetical protein
MAGTDIARVSSGGAVASTPDGGKGDASLAQPQLTTKHLGGFTTTAGGATGDEVGTTRPARADACSDSFLICQREFESAGLLKRQTNATCELKFIVQFG